MRSASLLLVLLLMTACGNVGGIDVPPVEEPGGNQLQSTPTSVDLTSRRGPVNDEQAAIAIAYETWIFPYGKETIDDEKPYTAELRKGVWHVYGSLPKGAVGGVAEAWISQTDGHVIRYMHGE